MTAEPPATPLKILIVSTPKTGNTWLKYLLAAIYDLPIVEFPMPANWIDFDPSRYDELGARWVAHQHIAPLDAVIRWAQTQEVILVTTVRHPADTLVSMYHYVQNYHPAVLIDPGASQLLFAPHRPQAQTGAIPFTDGLATYVREKFFYSLNYSIAWLHTGLSHGVRYEALWHASAETLRALTDQIEPVAFDRITRAVTQCHIDVLRVRGVGRAFYRAGGVQVWKTSLPRRIIELFQEWPPYPRQFAWLNYELELPKQRNVEPRASDRRNHLPFSDEKDFDWLTAQVYSSFLHERTADDGCRRSMNEFCSWLNAPARDDPQKGRVSPVVTNLGAYIYRGRPDLRRAFPDLYGRDRPGFSHWFIEYMPLDYPELDISFVARVCESWVKGPRPRFSPVHVAGTLRGAWRDFSAVG